MPRKPRFYLPDVTVHIVQRGHSRQPVFYEPQNYRAYLAWLQEAADRYRCVIHSYVLMTNHVHILATPRDVHGISRMMQYIGRYYVPHINYLYGTSGTLWEGRYKASLVQEAIYLLVCMRYIELNPVRANMVNHPREYCWSSYRTNAEGLTNKLITPHENYLALGKTCKERRVAYRSLFKAHIDDADLKKIRAAWLTGTPLGNDYFREQVERKLKIKTGQDRRGRPKKGSDPF